MQETIDQMPNDIERFPMVPIRDVVIFPFTKVAFKIGRPSSVKALETAMKGERNIFLATQHDATIDEPNADQIYKVGTIGRILQAQRQDNGQIKVVVEGRDRGESVRVEQDEDGCFSAMVRRVESVDESGYRTDGLLQQIHGLVEQFLRIAPDAYTDALHASLRGVSSAQIADAMSSHLKIAVDEKQKLLESYSVPERLQELVDILEVEIEKKQLDRTVSSRTKKQMDKTQREYYLNEQIKAIHKELGRKDEKAELDEIKKQIEEVGLSEEAKEKALQEFSRLEAMPPMSAESTVARTYLDWLINVPWQQRSEEIEDLAEAEEILNEDHFGLEKIKERILEYLAVRQLVKNPKGTILCFVGAPGVGKTSLGKSIARATGREFVRLALGGVHDEAVGAVAPVLAGRAARAGNHEAVVEERDLTRIVRRAGIVVLEVGPDLGIVADAHGEAGVERAHAGLEVHHAFKGYGQLVALDHGCAGCLGRGHVRADSDIFDASQGLDEVHVGFVKSVEVSNVSPVRLLLAIFVLEWKGKNAMRVDNCRYDVPAEIVFTV